ncbi:MAG TPA: acetate--CoA ligase family protein [Burkholderiaceae bacterium]|nr:acetate--CoA ligase family protein [Burkholderiaceae bacterium]
MEQADQDVRHEGELNVKPLPQATFEDRMMSVASVFNPTSVAIIGASDNPNKVGGRAIHYMRKFGYCGRIFPVNPARQTIQGMACYASLEDIGEEVPDAAIIAVSGEDAVEAVHRCAKRGVSTAVVMSSGFAEIGAAGRKLQEELLAGAQEHGMRLVGPNAQGIANFASGAILNFSTMFTEVAPQDGPIAIISQSGAASVMPYALLREKGLGVRYLASTGNDADLGVSELVRSVTCDPDIRLILIYVEAITRPDLLAEAAHLAFQRGTRIILLKGGSSQKGAAAAASHTGALVGQDGALDAFLAQNGIWRAQDVHGLVNAAALYLDGFPSQSGRTVVMSHSGAVGVLCADAAERAGLPLTELDAATRDTLRNLLPGFATAANPLDLTAALLGNDDMFPRVLEGLGSCREADMLLIGIPVAGPGYDIPALADATAAFALQRRKPVAVTAPQLSVRKEFQERGIPTFASETDAVQALSQYFRHSRLQANWKPATSSQADPDAGHGQGLLDEAESLDRLAKYGLPVVDHVVCGDAETASRAASRWGGPLVVKGCAAQVPHKTEHSLVHLHVSGEEQARVAAQDCLDKLSALGIEEPRVLVARMVKAQHEFMLGVTVDPLFGPAVTIGEGGILVEIRRDVVSILAPFSEEEALSAIMKLRIAPILRGYRHAPPLDARALARAAVALGRFAIAHRNVLQSADLNPVMVLQEGHGVSVVDAVIEFKEEV